MRGRTVARLLALFFVGWAVAGCEALLTEPAPAEGRVSIQFQVAAAPIGGTATAFSRVRYVGLRLVRPDNTVRDTLISVTPSEGAIRVALSLPTDERVDGLGIGAQLGVGLDILFAGATVVSVTPGELTRAVVPIVPVPEVLEADREQFTFAGVGATETFKAALLYATGDTIDGLLGVAGIWSSSAPTVVSIAPNGLAVAATPGTAVLEVRFDSLADTVRVTVPAIPMSSPER